MILVAFYNKKALGVRYLEAALERAGYLVTTIFYKDFNSVHPRPSTRREMELFLQVVREKQPLLVGLSVMSSMYLDTVYQLMDGLGREQIAPLVCGGAYATMFPEKLLERGADFVIRSDGERAICRLAEALRLGNDWRSIPSLCWREEEKIRQNEIGDLLRDVDGYGIPVVNSAGACFIDHDAIVWGDPQRNTRSYEVIASRGCPFTCSYCCCVNLRRLLPRGIPGVRTRSVNSVIDELRETRRHCKKIVFVHFYDEIFPNLPGWVDEFAEKYEKYIHLPFTIWSHPKMVELERIMYAPMEEQFGAYWKREVSLESQLWYEMIYCWQFACFRSRLRRWESCPESHAREIHGAYRQAGYLARLRYVWKKGNIVFRRMRMERPGRRT